MTDKLLKVIIAHPDIQHSFKTAIALKDKGILYKYITTSYMKKGSISEMVSHLPIRSIQKKFQKHFCDELDDEEIIQFCELWYFLWAVVNTAGFKNSAERIRKQMLKVFNKKLARYAIQNKVDAVITYDIVSGDALEYLSIEEAPIKKIVDMSAACYLYMDELYNKASLGEGIYKERLKEEISTGIIYCHSINSCKKELKYADAFLVPSSYVERSLIVNGIDKSKIWMCPYGIKENNIDIKNYDANEDRPLICTYVGSIGSRKGTDYLLEAVDLLSKDDYQFRFIGYDKYTHGTEIIKRGNCTYYGYCSHEKVLELLKESDILIHPSISDSFAFSCMEAMLCGLPIIVTDNTGVSDFVVDGCNGFVVPTADSAALKEKIEWFYINRSSIENMGINARDTALQHTWDQYNHLLTDAVTQICAE